MKKMPLKTWIAYYVLVALAIVAPFSWATIVGPFPYTLTNGTTADASQVMANYQSISDDVNANAAKNGANSDITALLGLTTPIAPASGGTNHFPGGTTTGAANAQVLATTSPDTFTLTAGYSATFTAGFTNTSTTTLNVNGTGATNVFKASAAGPVALGGGEIVANNKVTVIYDGTQYQIINARQQYGALTSIASATTTDLGTVLSHNANVTGTTAITGFGSSASATDPFYKITFAGALTLTHNGTSLILPGGANITTAANASAEAIYLGSGNWRVTQYQAPAVSPNAGQLARVNVYTSNDTWTLGAAERSVVFQCAGGAGAGGGSGNTTGGAGSQGSAGAGGGAGGYAILYVTAPAASYTITIGAGGTPVSDGTGGNGGNTTVGAILTCNGGTGGGRIAVTGTTSVLEGPAGGTASSGDLNMTGSQGERALVTGDAAGNYYPTGGRGGSNPLGAGAAGGTSTSGDGSANTGLGCGGGGGGTASALGPGTAHAGGAGAPGCVIAYTYY